MALTAKFNGGFCYHCKQVIKKGERIFWNKKNGSRHTKCVHEYRERKKVLNDQTR